MSTDQEEKPRQYTGKKVTQGELSAYIQMQNELAVAEQMMGRRNPVLTEEEKQDPIKAASLMDAEHLTAFYNAAAKLQAEAQTKRLLWWRARLAQYQISKDTHIDANTGEFYDYV